MKTQKFLPVALLALLAVSVTAQARPGPDGGPFGGFAGAGIMNPAKILRAAADRIGLDDTQRQEVRNILEAAKPELKALRESAKANREAMQALDSSDANYSIDLTTIAEDNGRLATEATMVAARIREEVNAVLTEEQRAELATLRAERGEKRRQRR